MSDDDYPTPEQTIRIFSFALALCAIATRQGTGFPQTDGGVVKEARAISEAVAEELERIRG